MQSLLFAIAAVALCGAMLYGGTSIFKNDAPARVQAKNNIIAVFHEAASTYQAYLRANNVPPVYTANAATDAVTTAGTWYAQLVPGYIPDLKIPLNGLTWRYGNTATDGNYFCLYGPVPQAWGNGASDTVANFPANSFIVDATACGVRSGTPPSSWPATLYLTYWLKGS